MIDRALWAVGLKRVKRKQNPLSSCPDIDWGKLEYSPAVATVITILEQIWNAFPVLTRNQDTLARMFEAKISRIEKPVLDAAAESGKRQREIILKLEQNTLEAKTLKSACKRFLDSQVNYELKLSELAEKRSALYEKAIARLKKEFNNKEKETEESYIAAYQPEPVRFGNNYSALRIGYAMILPIGPDDAGICRAVDIIKKTAALRAVVGRHVFVGVCCLAEVEESQIDSIAEAFQYQRTFLIEPAFLDSFARSLNLKPGEKTKDNIRAAPSPRKK